MITKRVRGREFRLRPSKRTNELVLYVVAVIARRTKVKVHAITVMSNHWHVCLSDPEGRVCDFTRDCHAFIARAANASHGDSESLWSSQQTSHVECLEPDDLIGRIAYTMANPVEAGLVRYGKSWPGVRTAWPDPPRKVRRPRRFFRGAKDRGAWPEEVIFELSRPERYDELDDDELAALIDGAITEREEKFRKEADRKGKRFLGRRGVLAQSRYARPETHAPRSSMSPRIACKNKWKRIERLQKDSAWSRAYADALSAWMSGDRDAVFPYGTYKMRVLHRVLCASGPD